MGWTGRVTIGTAGSVSVRPEQSMAHGIAHTRQTTSLVDWCWLLELQTGHRVQFQLKGFPKLGCFSDGDFVLILGIPF